jgi:hypothetical protein
LQSATRRFSPPESWSTSASSGGQRSASIATSIWLSRSHRFSASISSCSFGHLVGGLVRVVHGQFVVAVELGLLGLHPQHHVAAHVERGVKLGLLRQVADARALGGPGLAGEILVDAGHDAQQRGLARAVDADDADLHAGQEVQADVLETLLAAGIGLGDAVHVIDVLIGCHVDASAVWGFRGWAWCIECAGQGQSGGGLPARRIGLGVRVRQGFPVARAGMRVGLLGGSFDPAHEGHAHITREALKRLGLDRVWWLVSPGNPLKREGPAALDRRMAAARA